MSTRDIADRIADQISGPEAERVVEKYYADGNYTGAWFDSPEVASNNPNQIDAADMAAVATLSINITRNIVVGLLRRRKEIQTLLQDIPMDVDLVSVEEQDLEPLWDLQSLLNKISGIGPVTRSKLLAHKRPHLVPIRDTHVLAALGIGTNGNLTLPPRDALQSRPELMTRLIELSARAGDRAISPLRALDVVLWMRQYGDTQVA